MSWNANARIPHAPCVGKGCPGCQHTGSESGAEDLRRVQLHGSAYFLQEDGRFGAVHRVAWVELEAVPVCGIEAGDAVWHATIRPVTCVACRGEQERAVA